MMGIIVEKCSKILEDNKAVIMNMQLTSITLKNKHNYVACLIKPENLLPPVFLSQDILTDRRTHQTYLQNQ